MNHLEKHLHRVSVAALLDDVTGAISRAEPISVAPTQRPRKTDVLKISPATQRRPRNVIPDGAAALRVAVTPKDVPNRIHSCPIDLMLPKARLPGLADRSSCRP